MLVDERGDALSPGESTGSSNADIWIKVIQKLGFPIAVASVLLVILYGLISDYRESVKVSTSSTREMATAATDTARAMQSISGVIERLDDSFRDFEINQVETHTILKQNQVVLEAIQLEQKKTNEVLTRDKAP